MFNTARDSGVGARGAPGLGRAGRRCGGALPMGAAHAAPIIQTCLVESFERRAAAEGRGQIFQAIVGQPVQVQTAAEDGCKEQDGEEGFQVRLPE